MKIGQLRCLGHNIADSLASGIGLMIGIYQSDVFAEAASTDTGYVCVNFIDGQVVGGSVSDSFLHAVFRYKEALPDLCKKHGLDLAEIKSLKTFYSTDRVHGPHFTVTVEAIGGKRSVDRYIGVPGKLMRRSNNNPYHVV